MFDLIIFGGGLGGCAAAMAACSQGLKVLMTEETDWIGGQSTSQAVPPDEHPWIEEFGCTAKYRQYREDIRTYYLKNMPVAGAASREGFNPGGAIVSNISHDPRVSVHVLNEMLSPYLLTGRLTLLLETAAVSVTRTERSLQCAELMSLRTGERMTVEGSYFIDATETGDILPMASMEYVTGSESREETGEPHATEKADPNNIQGFTYVLAFEYDENGSHVIPKPEMYDFWKEYQPAHWPDKMLSLVGPHPVTLERREYALFADGSKFPLWKYRRVYSKEQYDVADANEVTLLNWPQNDYFIGNIYEVSEEDKKKHLHGAQQLSLSLLYWLQTEAPRPDGGSGYPGLRLRGDVVGTPTGFAKAPYIRESRRIRGLYTITEQDVSPASQTARSAKKYEDRVGLGSYSIDLHPSFTGVSYVDIPALPYHIPLGALIPRDMDNLLAGNKNIGTTHITNGCYRLHPTEWNIGEVCGELAAYCIQHDCQPAEVRGNTNTLHDFQQTLREAGVQLEWPDEFYEQR
ncbi:FAD-dependent oxidoreductase [Paenibacillus sp. J23TS9]|uniref:FAD-dependent oxidoreductase n=1 Tax=Paenibacillus sp. J23TS9 TaxID=2807193 RepID=UPI001B27685B|nr:FAD-dependent oxidoreductase [Paenibacillus sp. J23TS9]GIP27443.1 FAD-dependent oxidoreductase [Paenibacillus sp. J23TS9]